MRVNILGVGRSGTSALHTYATYVLASKEGIAWMNAEPYGWVTRKGPISVEGQRHYVSSGMLLEDDARLTADHDRFLRRLVDHPMSIVTKFTRANGLVRQVTRTMNPDVTFLIIRDVREVLVSLDKFGWDLHSGLLRGQWKLAQRSWERFYHAARRWLAARSESLSERIDWTAARRNALYWYVANANVLECDGVEVVVVLHDELRSSGAKVVSALGHDPERFPDVVDPRFRTKDVNFDYPLTDVRPRPWLKWASLFNQTTHATAARMGLSPWVMRLEHGGAVRVSDSETAAAKFEQRQPRRHSAPPPPLKDSFVEELRQRLRNRLRRRGLAASW